MSDYRFALPAVNDVDEVRHLVEQLRAAIERSVAEQAKVVSRPAEVDDGDFSQRILVGSQRGQLEVEVVRSNGEGAVEVSVRSPQRRLTSYLPVALALAMGFVADKTPEILPILRGLRVTLGAVAGLVVGVCIVAILGAFGIFDARVDATLEKHVRAALREVLLARGANAQPALVAQ